MQTEALMIAAVMWMMTGDGQTFPDTITLIKTRMVHSRTQNSPRNRTKELLSKERGQSSNIFFRTPQCCDRTPPPPHLQTGPVLSKGQGGSVTTLRCSEENVRQSPSSFWHNARVFWRFWTFFIPQWAHNSLRLKKYQESACINVLKSCYAINWPGATHIPFVYWLTTDV